KEHIKLWFDPPSTLRFEDLDSKNGTYVDGIRARQGFLTDQSLLRTGVVLWLVELGPAVDATPQAPKDNIVRSPPSPKPWKEAEQVGGDDINVLILGETGSGKDRLAEFIHRKSNRGNGPFVVVNCGELTSEALFESRLFGHSKGSFTGADRARLGAFAEAD